MNICHETSVANDVSITNTTGPLRDSMHGIGFALLLIECGEYVDEDRGGNRG